VVDGDGGIKKPSPRVAMAMGLIDGGGELFSCLLDILRHRPGIHIHHPEYPESDFQSGTMDKWI
jgi:hypothetical protein